MSNDGGGVEGGVEADGGGVEEGDVEGNVEGNVEGDVEGVDLDQLPEQGPEPRGEKTYWYSRVGRIIYMEDLELIARVSEAVDKETMVVMLTERLTERRLKGDWSVRRARSHLATLNDMCVCHLRTILYMEDLELIARVSEAVDKETMVVMLTEGLTERRLKDEGTVRNARSHLATLKDMQRCWYRDHQENTVLRGENTVLRAKVRQLQRRKAAKRLWCTRCEDKRASYIDSDPGTDSAETDSEGYDYDKLDDDHSEDETLLAALNAAGGDLHELVWEKLRRRSKRMKVVLEKRMKALHKYRKKQTKMKRAKEAERKEKKRVAKILAVQAKDEVTQAAFSAFARVLSPANEWLGSVDGHAALSTFASALYPDVITNLDGRALSPNLETDRPVQREGDEEKREVPPSATRKRKQEARLPSVPRPVPPVSPEPEPHRPEWRHVCYCCREEFRCVPKIPRVFGFDPPDRDKHGCRCLKHFDNRSDMVLCSNKCFWVFNGSYPYCCVCRVECRRGRPS